MSEVYRTYGKISSVSTEKGNTLQEIELDFEKNYRAEIKIECDSNPQILGVAQFGKEYASPNKHKLIDNKFVINPSLQTIALSAMDKNRLVELEFQIKEDKGVNKNKVTKIKVK